MRSYTLPLKWVAVLWLFAGLSARAQNLALNKTATASSSQQPAANAVDGNGGTRWESDFSDPQYFQVDLGAVQPIDRIKLTWENAYGKDFTLQVSDDGTTWTTVTTVTTNNTTLNEYPNLAASGRYVKMAGTARNSIYGYSLFEFEVYNYSLSPTANLALGKAATASSVEGQYLAGLAFDGDGATRWGSARNDNEWVYVDLGRAAQIKEVDLYWETAFGKDFRIETSNDALTWTPIATVTGNTSHTNYLAGLAGTGRYVRMFGVTRGTVYGFSLYEFQVFGSYVAGPLPVVLTDFRAVATGGAVALAWGTASELHNQGFGVQRSADGHTFADLAWVAGAGEAQGPHAYRYRDAAPLGGTSFYRLKQLDADGKIAYSEVQAVRWAAPVVVTAFPNPAADQVTLAWPAADASPTRWALTNALGQLVHAENLTAPGSLALDLRPYAPGTYVLTVLDGARVVGRTKVQKTL